MFGYFKKFFVFISLGYAILLSQEEKGIEELIYGLQESEVEIAIKEPVKFSEVPAIVSVITADEIKERGFRNLGEILQSIPGFYAHYDWVGYDVGVRGIMGGIRAWSRVLKIMIDGQPVSYKLAGYNFLTEDLIPVEAIERIEVIRGPGSALYGANAFMGVVNIVIKKDYKDKILSFRGEGFPTLEEYGLGGYGSFALGQKINPNVGFFITSNYKYRKRDNLSLPEISPNYSYFEDKLSKDDIEKPLNLYSKFEIKDTKTGSHLLSFWFHQVDVYGEFQDWGVLTHKNRISYTDLFVRYKWERDFRNKLWNISLSFAYLSGGPLDKERLYQGANLGYYLKRDEDYKSLEGILEIKHKIGKGHIIFGSEVIYDTFDLTSVYMIKENGEEKPLQEQGWKSFLDLGVYLQFWYWFRKMGMVLGGRLDKHSLYGTVPSTRFGLVFPLFKEGYLKILYGGSFKAPSAYQLYAVPLVVGDPIGNDSLKSEYAHIGEIGVLLPLKIKNRKISIFSNAYYILVKNKIDFIQKGLNVVSENRSKIHSMGFENEVRTVFGKMGIVWTVFYNYAVIEDKDLLKGTVYNETALFPRFSTTLSFDYKISKSFSIVPEISYLGKRKASESNIRETVKMEEYYYDPVLFLNIALNYRIKIFGKETFMQLKGFNLLNEDWVEGGYKGVDIPGRPMEVIFYIQQTF